MQNINHSLRTPLSKGNKAQNKLELIIRFSNWINENVSFVEIKYNPVVDFLEQDEDPNDKDLERFIKNIGKEIKQQSI